MSWLYNPCIESHERQWLEEDNIIQKAAMEKLQQCTSSKHPQSENNGMRIERNWSFWSPLTEKCTTRGSKTRYSWLLQQYQQAMCYIYSQKFITTTVVNRDLAAATDRNNIFFINQKFLCLSILAFQFKV